MPDQLPKGPPGSTFRADAFLNAITGYGTARDKREYARAAVQFLSQNDFENLYRGSDLGGTLVESLPDELLREGFRIKIEGKQELEEDVNAYLEGLNVLPHLTEALYWSRQHGGAGILIGADDGSNGDFSLPLDFDRIKDIGFFTTLTRWELFPLYYYGDPLAPKYARVSVFFLQQLFGLPQEVVDPAGMQGGDPADVKKRLAGGAVGNGPSAGRASDQRGAFVPQSNSLMTQMLNYPEITFKATPKGYQGRGVDESGKRSSLVTTAAPLRTVHESRMLQFDGVPVTRVQRVRNNGWGDSIFTRVYRVLRDYEASWDSVSHLMQDLSQAVAKLQGLNDLVTMGDDNATSARIALLDLMRSSGRLLYLDAGKEGETTESFERVPSQLQEIPEILQQFALRLAAAARMPVSLLMGQAPSGLNATGDADVRWYYDRIRAKQNSELMPALRYLMKVLFACKSGPTAGKEPDNWSIVFNPLWQLGSLEEAQRRLTIAQADKIYMGGSQTDAPVVVLPTEVAKSRFGNDVYSGDTIQLDQDTRDKAAVSTETELETHGQNLENKQEQAAKGPQAPVGVQVAETWVKGPSGELVPKQTPATGNESKPLHEPATGKAGKTEQAARASQQPADEKKPAKGKKPSRPKPAV